MWSLFGRDQIDSSLFVGRDDRIVPVGDGVRVIQVGDVVIVVVDGLGPVDHIGLDGAQGADGVVLPGDAAEQVPLLVDGALPLQAGDVEADRAAGHAAIEGVAVVEGRIDIALRVEEGEAVGET